MTATTAADDLARHLAALRGQLDDLARIIDAARAELAETRIEHRDHHRTETRSIA